MTDHYAETNRLTDGLRGLQGHNAGFDMALAQVHATLELAEQQRIANLIALGAFDGDDGAYNRQIVGQYPEIARALRIEAP